MNNNVCAPEEDEPSEYEKMLTKQLFLGIHEKNSDVPGNFRSSIPLNVIEGLKNLQATCHLIFIENQMSNQENK